MVRVGDLAPTFRLPSTSGRDVSLEDYRGRKLVLYFYTKDDSSSCTTEACDFRDNMSRLREGGAEVLGVSKDTMASHDSFREKHFLPFDLLSDPEENVAAAYGAYGQKELYGQTVMGTIRSTFLIDENGRIEEIWSPVRVEGHVDEVLARLRGEAPAPRLARVQRPAPALKAETPSVPVAKSAAKKAPPKKAGPKKAEPKKAAAKKAKPKKAKPKKAAAKKARAGKAKKKVARKVAKRAIRKAAKKSAKKQARRPARKAKAKAGRRAVKKAARKKVRGKPRKAARKAKARKVARKTRKK